MNEPVKSGVVNVPTPDAVNIQAATITVHEGCLCIKSVGELKHISDACAEKVKELNVTDKQPKEIIPKTFCNDLHALQNLLSLKFSGNQLESVPLEICILHNLEHLEISDNNLLEIPEDIGKLCNLKLLNVSNNALENLPYTICDLGKLSHFNISGNSLQFLSDAFGKLVHLCHLDVSRNKLVDMSESLAHLDNLKTFNLSANQIQSNLPACFFMGMKSITTLDLSHNLLHNLQALPLCAPSLKKLNLSHNLITLVPEWICVACGSLEEIDLSYNEHLSGTAEDPKDLYVCGGGIRSTLKRLDISDCKVTSRTTDFVGSFKNLVELSAGNGHLLSVRKSKLCALDANLGNMFWDIPATILLQSSYLTVLCLPAVGLSVLPENISELNALQVLDLRSNELHFLNDQLCQLTSLTRVMLSDNFLRALPHNIGTLCELTELHISGNQIPSLPASFSLLTNLLYLDLYDNCLNELVPDCILNSSILKGLDLEQNNCQTITLKSFTPYEELKMKMRSWGNKFSIRTDGGKQDSASEEEDDEDSLDSFASWGPASDLNSHPDEHSTEDPELFISPSDSNWDSPIEDESDWAPTECTYFNVRTKIKSNVNPPSILPKRTFAKPNLVWQEGQFDTDAL